MKQFTAMVLTLILAFSLTVSALAAEDTAPPLWQTYGFDSREECIQYLFDGDEAAYQEEVEDALERQRWEASMADQIAAFDADAYWESGECWQAMYYLSKEEFMRAWLLDSEEAFRECLLEDWLDNQWLEYQMSQQVAKTRAELGGTAGQLGVMLDGRYIQFPDAAPEVRYGRTMAPCRQVLEAFGGTVRHEDGQVVCALEGMTLRFRDGSDTVSVTAADGTESAIQMDVPCYYQNGRTYVPIRFFAEALGCDVLWDRDYETAVLLRRDRIAEQINARFTVLNRMLAAMAQDAEQNYKTVISVDGQLTLLDSINGNKTCRIDADMNTLRSGSAIHFTAEMDLSDLTKLEAITEGMSALEVAALKKSLRELTMEVIYDGEKGMLYAKLPALSQLTYGIYADDSWIAAPAAPMAELRTGGCANIGDLLYESQMAYAAYGSPALLYGNLTDAADELAACLGDSCFQESGGYSVLHYGEEDYKAALAAEYGDEYAQWANEFEQLELELKVSKSGSAAFKILLQNKDLGYGDVFFLDASGSISAARTDMQMLMKLKNQFDLSLRFTAGTAVTRDEPATAPPAGAKIVSAYGEYDAGESAA